jgi:vacuolar-type H+-ATPase subunit E/Vma4
MSAVDDACEGLRAEARDDAARLLAEADLDAEATLRRAREEATAIVERARAEGRVEGRIAAGREEAQLQLTVRMSVLAAQRASFEAFRERARRAALELRREPGYGDLLERLAAAARRDLGPDAEVEVDPPDAGGVRARAGTRRVDLTLAAIADRCIDDLGPAARRLWE